MNQLIKFIPLTLAAFLLLFALACNKSSDKDDDTPMVTLPEVVTAKVFEVKVTTAQVGGNVLSDGGTLVTARGMCWSTSEDPTISGSHTTDSIGKGYFTSQITGLNPQTTYYLRAYATNSVGTVYGEQVSIKTYLSTITDAEGNVYKTIKIGTQEWMAENLKVTKYRNGDVIPLVTDNIAWGQLNTGAYCNPINDVNNVPVYGRLFNFYVVADARNVCPTGWHVPGDNEWSILVAYLGGYAVAGGKMKETGKEHWTGSNTEATNESGFTALPSGFRASDGSGFGVLGYNCYWWAKTEYTVNEAYERYLNFGSEVILSSWSTKRYGYSVRCVRDSI